MKTKYEDAVKLIKDLEKHEFSGEKVADFYVQMGLVEPKKEVDLLDKLENEYKRIKKSKEVSSIALDILYRHMLEIVKKLINCDNCKFPGSATHIKCYGCNDYSHWKMK